jgi:NADP-dependent 3-hydroxy acid dehydrogenase YdfG
VRHDLRGKAALVTGASAGIGEATALALAAAGVSVVVSARRADRLEALARRIEALGGKVVAAPGDVVDETLAERAVQTTVEAFGTIDILVNSAGIIQAGQVSDARFEEWRRVMDVNFFGALYPCKFALSHMKRQGSGDIVNVSSISGRRMSAALFGAYGPSKHALNSFSEALRQEAGAHGVRVCVIEPGATATEVAENIRDEGYREAMRKHVGRESAVLPEEVANAIVYVLQQPPRVNISELLIRPTDDVLPL